MLETEKSFEGETGLELTNVEWLVDHHKTKEQERRQTVDDLNLKPGDVVLDLGCGVFGNIEMVLSHFVWTSKPHQPGIRAYGIGDFQRL